MLINTEIAPQQAGSQENWSCTLDIGLAFLFKEEQSSQRWSTLRELTFRYGAGGRKLLNRTQYHILWIEGKEIFCRHVLSCKVVSAILKRTHEKVKLYETEEMTNMELVDVHIQYWDLIFPGAAEQQLVTVIPKMKCWKAVVGLVFPFVAFVFSVGRRDVLSEKAYIPCRNWTELTYWKTSRICDTVIQKNAGQVPCQYAGCYSNDRCSHMYQYWI